jgi:homoserine dehydrogenase
MGISEIDPSADVTGRDTAVKLVLLVNSIFREEFALSDVSISGITNLTLTDMKNARAKNRRLKLIGLMQKTGDAFHLEVGVRKLAPSHPLFGVCGTDKGISFQTDSMGRVTVTGGKSDPRGAAAALLKDIIQILGSLL